MVAMILGQFYETGLSISIDELIICLRTIVRQTLGLSLVEFLGQRSEQHDDCWLIFCEHHRQLGRRIGESLLGKGLKIELVDLSLTTNESFDLTNTIVIRDLSLVPQTMLKYSLLKIGIFINYRRLVSLDLWSMKCTNSRTKKWSSLSRENINVSNGIYPMTKGWNLYPNTLAEARSFLSSVSIVLIEPGKRDLFSNAQLFVASFRSDGTFHVFDLVTLQKHSPERIQSIWQDVIDRLCDEGLLRIFGDRTGLRNLIARYPSRSSLHSNGRIVWTIASRRRSKGRTTLGRKSLLQSGGWTGNHCH